MKTHIIFLTLFLCFRGTEGQGLLGELGRQLGLDLDPRASRGPGGPRGPGNFGGPGGFEGPGGFGGPGGFRGPGGFGGPGDHRGHGDHGVPGMDLGKMINNILYPPPQSNIPPHVFRRIVRFCSKFPDHPKCRHHPEWVRGDVHRGPMSGGGGLDLNEMFPDLVNFKLPPIPKINLPDVLRNVPDFLKTVVPAPILGQITEFAKNAIKVSF